MAAELPDKDAYQAMRIAGIHNAWSFKHYQRHAHPDKGGDTEMFKWISHQYTLVSDSDGNVCAPEREPDSTTDGVKTESDGEYLGRHMRGYYAGKGESGWDSMFNDSRFGFEPRFEYDDAEVEGFFRRHPRPTDCKAMVTKKTYGEIHRCGNTARKGSTFCHVHRKYESPDVRAKADAFAREKKEKKEAARKRNEARKVAKKAAKAETGNV